MTYVLLNDIKVRRSDKIDQMLIDEFIRKSPILAAMPFADTVSPQGGSTLTYNYVRLKTAAIANGREINGDYTAGKAEKEKLSTDLKIMGGSYQIDRVLGAAAPDEIPFQTDELIEATINKYHYMFINGDKDVTGEFDGLAAAVDGSDTDFTSAVDASTMSAAVAIKFCEEIDTAITLMKTRPTFILANYKGAVKLASAARTLGYFTQAESAFGTAIGAYNGIPIVDLGNYYNESLGSTTEIIPYDPASGKTDIYLVTLATDAVHGITITDDNAITQRLPDFTTAGAVKTGDVEFVAGLAIKNTRALARIKGVQVQSTLTSLGALDLTVAANLVTMNVAKPKIGNAYYYVKSNASITAPTANTAINTSVYTALPANGVIALSVNDFVRVVEVYSDSLLPIATGTTQLTA